MRNFSSFWQVKTFTGFIMILFSPVEIAFVSLLVLILIDTLTGIMHAYKFKRFTSSRLRKAVNKICLYSLAIITARLLEMGIFYFFQTNMISQFIVGFLIITEAISIIENLIILGVPIPKDFISILLRNIKMFGLEKVMLQGLDEHSGSKDIEEIIDYQLPAVKNQSVRKVLELEFEGYSKIILFIKKSLDSEATVSNDVIYYKLMAYIETIKKENTQKLKEYNIPKACIEEYDKWIQDRKELFLQSIKSICYSSKDYNTKSKDLIDKILIMIYQSVIEALKNENYFKC